MNVQLDKNYDYFTLEFENMYRSADDLFRKTKQTLEIYDVTGTLEALKTALADFAGTPSNNGIVEDTAYGAL